MQSFSTAKIVIFCIYTINICNLFLIKATNCIFLETHNARNDHRPVLHGKPRTPTERCLLLQSMPHPRH